ncbi:translation initiation factor eIF-2B subunit delta [Copidosoma floridanum]|uniref:translation initiation factor eIF-2B subunit delta n=1 Tax=Copidosoma floridanum TaxID=29053 RepID=UPI0006C9BAC5|nr:translation initiation factor eIF-2B subunit delta [Copidosoma floridanum]
MDAQEKSRDQIKSEREAKKLAKALAKGKKNVKDKGETSQPAVQPSNVQQSEVQQKPAVHKVNVVTQNSSEKSKKQLKEERRAVQEAQRAAKAAVPADKIKKPVCEKKDDKAVTIVKKEAGTKKTVTLSAGKDNSNAVDLFKHLYIDRNNIARLLNSSYNNIHPAIIRLGVQYAEKVIVGSNARCVALLAALKQLTNDFECPLQADFTRELEASLVEAKKYLDFCRPFSVSMENALKHLQRKMCTFPATISDKEAKLKLADVIDTYIEQQIDLADKAIAKAIQKKIFNGDVILTYGFSSVIHKSLCDAHDSKKQFRVIVVDGRPWLEGKELLRRLVKHGIDCSYVLINALSFIMPQVSKVFLGAHAILANGAVISRVGTAEVALMANAFNVPVLVACETHKSCKRVQTDSIVFNEIGDSDKLVKNTFSDSKKSCLSNWTSRKTLNLLNITYDVTPAELVTAVVTEIAILPCTSVATNYFANLSL